MSSSDSSFSPPRDKSAQKKKKAAASSSSDSSSGSSGSDTGSPSTRNKNSPAPKSAAKLTALPLGKISRRGSTSPSSRKTTERKVSISERTQELNYSRRTPIETAAQQGSTGINKKVASSARSSVAKKSGVTSSSSDDDSASKSRPTTVRRSSPGGKSSARKSEGAAGQKSQKSSYRSGKTVLDNWDSKNKESYSRPSSRGAKAASPPKLTTSARKSSGGGGKSTNNYNLADKESPKREAAQLSPKMSRRTRPATHRSSPPGTPPPQGDSTDNTDLVQVVEKTSSAGTRIRASGGASVALAVPDVDENVLELPAVNLDTKAAALRAKLEDSEFVEKFRGAIGKCAKERIVPAGPTIAAILRGRTASTADGESSPAAKSGPVRDYLARHVFPFLEDALVEALVQEGTGDFGEALAEKVLAHGGTNVELLSQRHSTSSPGGEVSST
ncbi:unnamed protein product [Amoebophrya sp. A120]|nr:unnamed protein product [Amoebophrya sp. A120]|eukprot:GSA120T00005426001.1